jgi:uncharacterized protein (TIGR04255 family)
MGKEVYPNAPLAWVTAEVRYPQSPRLRQQETLDQLQLDLEHLLPVVREEQQIVVQLGPQGPSIPDRVQAYRLLNRDATSSAVIGPQAVTVETSAYTRSEEFLSLMGAVVDAVLRRVPLVAIERIGLRYINEVRVPESINSISDWNAWLAPPLTAATQIGGASPPVALQGAVHYRMGDQRQMAFNYASLPAGTVIGPSVMRRQEIDVQRPVFVLDLDSFWEAGSPDQALAPDGQRVRELLDDLHQPISEVFEAILTDRLRQLLRGE